MNGKINDKRKSDDRTSKEQTSDDRRLTKINSWRTAWRSLVTKIFRWQKFSAIQYYRKRGSTSYIVREWLLWVVVVVERERETPVTSSISRWNREWSCIWLQRRHVDPTRRHVLTLSLSSARSACKDKNGAWRLSARSSSRVEWLMNDDGEVEALRSLVRLPWITQQHFVAMLKARKIYQVDVYFLFEWHRFCLCEQLG